MKAELIIQKDGKSYIKAKCTMLPTEKATNNQIVIENEHPLKGHLTISNDTLAKNINRVGTKLIGYTPQHLYFLSNEKIKEGDLMYWYVQPINKNRISKVTKEDIDYYTNMNNQGKKIIASTDESLRWNDDNYIQVIDTHFCQLPRPSNEFLKAYCKANGKIDEVFVEVDLRPDFPDDENTPISEDWVLKVAPDNSITIRKAEEERQYSKYHINMAIREAIMYPEKFMTGITHDDKKTFKWIEEESKFTFTSK